MVGNSNVIQISAGKEFKFKVKWEKLFKFKPRREKEIEASCSNLNLLVFSWDSFPFLLRFKTVPERNGFQV